MVEFRHRRAGIRSLLKNYFSKPLNSIPLSALLIGLVILLISFGYHPVVAQPVTQSSSYQVSQNATIHTAFTLFPGKTTYVSFNMPSGQEVNYSLSSLVELKVFPTLNNPTGIKVVRTSIASGIASDSTIITIPQTNLSLAISTFFVIQSVNGSTFNMTVTSLAYFNTTLKFSPSYAITGMGLTVGSITVLGSVAGIKREEK